MSDERVPIIGQGVAELRDRTRSIEQALARLEGAQIDLRSDVRTVAARVAELQRAQVTVLASLARIETMLQ